jgi:8-oxo-dGTP pyrophosphatase MutT (NUDIX family)
MKNFEFEHEGQKLWYSRSLACSLIILKYDKTGKKDSEILITKRGSGCEFGAGLWCIPGGFIDFDEDAKDCVIRETFEETGIDISAYKNVIDIKLLDSTPNKTRQSMCLYHMLFIEADETKDWKFSTEHAEPNEVSKIKWIKIKDIDKYNWLSNQHKYLSDILYMHQ